VRVFGRNVLKELLSSDHKNIIKNVFISKTAKGSINEIKTSLEQEGIRYTPVPAKTLDSLSEPGVRHQGIVVETKDFPYMDEDIVIENFQNKEKGFLLILDQVNDPQNLGSIIRTAYGAGVDAIVLSKDNTVTVNPTVIKVSTGLAYKINVAPATNLNRFIHKAKDAGFWVYGADMDGGDYHQIKWDPKTALVFGNEAKGIRRLVSENCDQLVSIPMKREMDSLNLSVSAGIITFDIAGRRKG